MRLVCVVATLGCPALAAVLLLAASGQAGCASDAATVAASVAGGSGGSRTTSPGAGGAGAGAGFDPGVGGTRQPCDCEGTDYWIEIRGDGEPQIFTRPYLPETAPFCEPQEPYLYSFWWFAGDIEWFHIIAACRDESADRSCIFLDDLTQDSAHYVDRSGAVWDLVDIAVQVEHPTPVAPAKGAFTATATAQGTSVLLEGDLQVCHVASVGEPI